MTESAEADCAVSCRDPVALNAWYVVAAVKDLQPQSERRVVFLGSTISVILAHDGEVKVALHASPVRRALPVRQKFGYVWTTLGTPDREIFDIPEYDEPGRRNLNAASVGVQVSAPRAVENFLDMAHFAFVHPNYLGVEPFTDIKPYDVAVSADGEEVVATRCRAYQPRASPSATGGFDVEYVYRVPHPYCALLYKSAASDPKRNDVIGLLLQPMSEESAVAHMLMSVVDNSSSDAEIRSFQQLIFAQDRPILENQLPKRLPLNSTAELSVSADRSSAIYRRWLRERRVSYGTISDFRY